MIHYTLEKNPVKPEAYRAFIIDMGRRSLEDFWQFCGERRISRGKVMTLHPTRGKMPLKTGAS